MGDFMTSDTIALLQAAIMNGIIDINDVQKKHMMEKEKRILEKHPFKKWEGKNGEWYTYLPDKSKSSQRRLLHRKTEKDLDRAIIKAFLKKEEENKACNLSDFYHEWLRSKSYHTNSTNYCKRIDSDWKKFYENDPISKKPFRELTNLYLDDWCHKKIKEYGMTKTCFYNMSMILRQMLEYAVDAEYINVNPMRKVKINTKLLIRNKKKADHTQVFMTDEQPLLEKFCMDRYLSNPRYTTPLAILLAFKTGVRFGELVALKKSDIEANYLHICRQEVIDYIFNEDNTFTYNGTKIIDNTKTPAGIREVYLTEDARKIIDMVLETNRRYHFEDEDFLFVHKNKRIIACSMEKKLYDYCEAAGISRKSSHKIRKTYISSLIDGKVNINTIRKLVGHEHESTTYGCYCFDRKRDHEVELALEDTLKSVSI